MWPGPRTLTLSHVVWEGIVDFFSICLPIDSHRTGWLYASWPAALLECGYTPPGIPTQSCLWVTVDLSYRFSFYDQWVRPLCILMVWFHVGSVAYRILFSKPSLIGGQLQGHPFATKRPLLSEPGLLSHETCSCAISSTQPAMIFSPSSLHVILSSSLPVHSRTALGRTGSSEASSQSVMALRDHRQRNQSPVQVQRPWSRNAQCHQSKWSLSSEAESSVFLFCLFSCFSCSVRSVLLWRLVSLIDPCLLDYQSSHYDLTNFLQIVLTIPFINGDQALDFSIKKTVRLTWNAYWINIFLVGLIHQFN